MIQLWYRLKRYPSGRVAFCPVVPLRGCLEVSGQRVFLWESPLFFRLRHQEKGRCV